MTIKELFPAAKKLIVAGVSKLFGAVISAKLEDIAKGGLFIGAAIFAVVVLVKGGMNTVKAVKENKNVSPVDRALGLNYSDRRRADEIDPMFDEIKRCLGRDLNVSKSRENSAKRRKWATNFDDRRVDYIQNQHPTLNDDFGYYGNENDEREKRYNTMIGVPLNKEEMGELDRFTREVDECLARKNSRGRKNADRAIVNILHGNC